MSTTGFVPYPQRGTLVGLGGKLRAGKDAVGDYLEQKHGYVKLGMSDALNEALLKLNPMIPEGWIGRRRIYTPYQELHAQVGYVEAKKNPEVRRLLQVLGTEVGRDMIDPDVWVKIAEKKIREHWANGKSVVITAMRFPNEIEMLERLEGLSVWVERPDELRLATGGYVSPEGADRVTDSLKAAPCVIPGMPQETLQAHASENSVSGDDFEYVLNNDGTLEQLYAKVEKRLIQREGTEKTYDGGGWVTPLVHSIPVYPPYDR